MTSSARKIVTGNWDGKEIWRYETAQDRLLAELHKAEQMKEENKYPSAFISEQEQVTSEDTK